MTNYSKFLSIITLVFLINLSSSNAQQISGIGFSFQGYARNLDGAALSSKQIVVQRSIYIPGNSAEFVEEETLTTDPFGVFQTVIGSVQSTSFKALDFSTKAYFMKVEVKPIGGTYATISDQALQSVPYAQAADNGVPVGTMIAFGGATVPVGWLLCDGASVSRTTYPQLFAAIGTAWGTANGTSFNVPETRGLFLRGVAGGNGNDPGRGSRGIINSGGNTGDAVGSYQVNDIQSHGHSASSGSAGGHTHNYTHPFSSDVNSKDVAYINGNLASKANEYPDTNGGTTNSKGNHSHTISVAASGGAETRPKNVYVNYIIRAK